VAVLGKARACEGTCVGGGSVCWSHESLASRFWFGLPLQELNCSRRDLLLKTLLWGTSAVKPLCLRVVVTKGEERLLGGRPVWSGRSVAIHGSVFDTRTVPTPPLLASDAIADAKPSSGTLAT
jgi:hypothetical protein